MVTNDVIPISAISLQTTVCGIHHDLPKKVTVVTGVGECSMATPSHDSVRTNNIPLMRT